jgi:hypothetical protein
MELLPADFEPGVSFLYHQVPSYAALYSDNSIGTMRAFPPGRSELYGTIPALRCKQPPPKPLTLMARRSEKGQLRDRED